MIDKSKEINSLDVIKSDDIFKSSDSTIIHMSKKFSTWTTIMRLFYKKRLSDIYMDIFDWTDIILLTWKKWSENINKYVFVTKKDNYTRDEKEMINKFKEMEQNWYIKKIIVVSWTPYELISFLFQWLVNKYNLYLEKTNETEPKTFYEFLLETSLNDNSFYLVDGYVVDQNKELQLVEINKNNRVNIFLSKRKIKEWLIKRILWFNFRPNYTDLKFEDVRTWMLSLFKLERYIFDFLTGWWQEVLKREKPEEYQQIINNNEYLNKTKKIINDFSSVLNRLWLPSFSDDMIALLVKAANPEITEEEKERLFQQFEVFWKQLKEKDDINKYFNALRSSASLVLITWPVGSGKTTFMMTGLQQLLTNEVRTVITLEDPVEFMLENDLWLVYQREVNKDVPSYIVWIKDTFREKPDIVVLWEIRENKSENLARQLVETAKTWPLILWTMHASKLYDAYARIKSLAGTEELHLNYIINMRRIPLLTGEFINLYTHYIYDDAKDTSTSMKDMKNTDSGFTGLNKKALMLFLIWLITVDEYNAIAPDRILAPKDLNTIQNNQFIQEIFSRETINKIQTLSNSTD